MPTPTLTAIGGPLTGFEIPEDDPSIIRAAQAHGFKYVLATDSGEKVWAFRGLAPPLVRPVGPRPRLPLRPLFPRRGRLPIDR